MGDVCAYVIVIELLAARLRVSACDAHSRLCAQNKIYAVAGGLGEGGGWRDDLA